MKRPSERSHGHTLTVHSHDPSLALHLSPLMVVLGSHCCRWLCKDWMWAVGRKLTVGCRPFFLSPMAGSVIHCALSSALARRGADCVLRSCLVHGPVRALPPRGYHLATQRATAMPEPSPQPSEPNRSSRSPQLPPKPWLVSVPTPRFATPTPPPPLALSMDSRAVGFPGQGVVKGVGRQPPAHCGLIQPYSAFHAPARPNRRLAPPSSCI